MFQSLWAQQIHNGLNMFMLNHDKINFSENHYRLLMLKYCYIKYLLAIVCYLFFIYMPSYKYFKISKFWHFFLLKILYFNGIYSKQTNQNLNKPTKIKTNSCWVKLSPWISTAVLAPTWAITLFFLLLVSRSILRFLGVIRKLFILLLLLLLLF